jgi:hypothetical protein
MHQISVKDFPSLDFGDQRRNARFVSIINNITRQPGSSIPKQNEDWYDTKATYSFFKNEDVSLSSLREAITGWGLQQVAGEERLLIVHDTSQISYDDLKADDLGYLAHKEGRGIMCYSSIAITEEGIPLSLLYQHNWTRPLDELGKKKDRKAKSFEDKESYHWYKGITEVNKQLGHTVAKLHIADREADIYDLFFCGYEENTDLLIRASHNRRLNDGSALWDQVAEMEAVAIVELQLPDATGKKRLPVKVEVRYRQVEILRPRDKQHQYESVEMTAISVKQVDDKESVDSIHWRLLTTVEATTTAQALQCVKWYTYRWLIERFHYVLKSGTRIEELQLKQASSLQKAIHVYSIAAMRIMQLVYQSRETPDLSCEVILTKEQWIVLYLLTHKNLTALPAIPPTLGEAVLWIGKLGGHLGRKSDGPPGLKTVWLGYQRICDAAGIYEQLFNIMNLGKG